MPLLPIAVLFLAPEKLGDIALISLLGFAIILIVKTVVFLSVSDFKKIRAVWYMIIATVISTLIGVLATFMFMSADHLFLGIVGIFLISVFPAFRIRSFERYRKYSKFSVVFIIAMITLIMIVFYAHSIGYQAPAKISLITKIIFSALGIGLSLMLGILYDESIISRLYYSSTKESKVFIRPVLWTNIISVLLILIIAGVWLLTAKAAPAIEIGLLLSVLTAM